VPRDRQTFDSPVKYGICLRNATRFLRRNALQRQEGFTPATEARRPHQRRSLQLAKSRAPRHAAKRPLRPLVIWRVADCRAARGFGATTRFPKRVHRAR
jgi:hypothetical protein